MFKLKTHYNIIFILLFFVILCTPLLLTNRKNNIISADENRYLAEKPVLYTDNGLNPAFFSDFDIWINDNIGLRKVFVRMNARLMYHIFHVLSNNSDMYIGRDNSFQYATDAMLADYQHRNLYSQESLDDICSAYQRLYQFLKKKGIRSYYVQCRDKHTVYPETFMPSVFQYGQLSLTDQVVNGISSTDSFTVIDLKDILISGKSSNDTFGRFTDPSHWTPYGAYLGYQEIMRQLDQDSAVPLRILNADDFDITPSDLGTTVFGGIHELDLQSLYQLHSPHAVINNTAIEPLPGTGHLIYDCPSSGNNDTLLIIGDSYIENYILSFIAESFGHTVFVWGDYTEHLPEFLDLYDPAIVIIENAERCSYRHQIIADLPSLY